MSKPQGLWKSTIVIWSPFDPQKLELSGLAWEAEEGEAYCTTQHTEYVPPESLTAENGFTGSANDFFVNDVFG